MIVVFHDNVWATARVAPTDTTIFNVISEDIPSLEDLECLSACLSAN
jgi:hypothetical protein